MFPAQCCFSFINSAKSTNGDNRPRELLRTIGTNATFHCRVHNKEIDDEQKFKRVWYKDGELIEPTKMNSRVRLESENEEDSVILRLKNVSLQDSGIYECLIMSIGNSHHKGLTSFKNGQHSIAFILKVLEQSNLDSFIITSQNRHHHHHHHNQDTNPEVEKFESEFNQTLNDFDSEYDYDDYDSSENLSVTCK